LAPEFFVKIKGEEKNCNIKIGDRYINYLAHIESEKTWYAIIRLSAFTLNKGMLATFTNTVFYKLDDDVINISDNTHDINIDENKYEFEENKAVGFIQKKSSTVIKLKDNTYTPITSKDKPIFYVLRKFRNQQLFSYELKMKATTEAADFVLDLALKQ